MQTTPAHVVSRTQSILGTFRGLTFGLLQYPYSRPDAFVQGEIQRTRTLASEQAGPRAVLNAIERLANSYREQVETAMRDVSLAEQQLRDYATQADAAFVHGEYMRQLRELRDELRRALAGYSAEDNGKVPSTTEVADRIKRLQSTQTIAFEAKRVSAPNAAESEEPIAARVSRRIGKKTERVEKPSAIAKCLTGQVKPMREDQKLIQPARQPFTETENNARLQRDLF